MHKKSHIEILETAVRLGYPVYGSQAREASEESSGIILVNVPSIDNPFYGEVVKGMRMAAQHHEYNLLIYEGTITDRSLPSLLTTIRQSHAIGIITVSQLSQSILSRINDLIPVVQCCEFNESAPFPYVTVDDFKIGVNAVEYLDSIGRRKIAFLNGPSEYKYARHRRMGFESGLQKCGIIFNPKLVISVSNIIPDLAFSAAMQLIKSDYPIDAFFTTSDVFAMAVIRAVKYSGLRVPQDIAVLGCDNISLSGYFTPSITTISQPCLQLGATAMELLVDRISNPDGFIQKIVLEPELIIREST